MRVVKHWRGKKFCYRWLPHWLRWDGLAAPIRLVTREELAEMYPCPVPDESDVNQ